MTEIAIIFTAAIAALGYSFFYLKRKKAQDESNCPKNDSTQPNIQTPAQPQKPTPPAPPAVENNVAAEPVQTATVQTETVETQGATIAEPILKRHHLSNIRMMLAVTSFPRPTDSALSRHYDEMIEAKAEDCLADEAKMSRLVADYEACQNEESCAECCDEEPMLKRHQLHNVRLMVMATTFPRPKDSALCRHYDEMIDAKAEDCLDNEQKMARLVAEYEAAQNLPVSEESSATAHAIPEDSALRRHYLSNLQANAENK